MSAQIDSTGRKNECIVFLHRQVQHLVQPLADGLVITAKKLAIGSCSYWVGCGVVLQVGHGVVLQVGHGVVLQVGHEVDTYTFGEVAYILECRGEYLLCCKKMTVLEYSRHYHSYVVQETGEYVMVQYAALRDPHPLAIYVVNERKHAMLKYHIH